MMHVFVHRVLTEPVSGLKLSTLLGFFFRFETILLLLLLVMLFFAFLYSYKRKCNAFSRMQMNFDRQRFKMQLYSKLSGRIDNGCEKKISLLVLIGC